MVSRGGSPSRLLLREGAEHYEPISWAAAYDLIADELKALESPDEAIFYTSGRASNESAFLYGVFARHFGTNNMPDCSNMCHESSGTALTESIGIGKGTVKIDDFAKAQVIFLIGHNPGTNHPRMLTTLAEAKQAGATIIAVNPLVEAGLLRFKDPQEFKGVVAGGQKLTDIYLQIRIGGDIPLFKGILKEMLALEDANPGKAFNWDFIKAHTAGIEEFIARPSPGGQRCARARVGSSAREDAPGGRIAGEIGPYHHLMVPGPDPAYEGGPRDPGTGEHQSASRCAGQTGRGRLPGARSFQCARRPHDGRLGKAPGTVPEQITKCLWLRSPAGTGP